MSRLTRKKDQYPCRMAGGCPADEWIYNHGGDPDDCCVDCPFEKYINALAKHEDAAEKLEDDGRSGR